MGYVYNFRHLSTPFSPTVRPCCIKHRASTALHVWSIHVKERYSFVIMVAGTQGPSFLKTNIKKIIITN